MTNPIHEVARPELEPVQTASQPARRGDTAGTHAGQALPASERPRIAAGTEAPDSALGDGPAPHAARLGADGPGGVPSSPGPAPRQGTDEWVRWRRGGVGASELPAILGEDPWRGEYELALIKRGEVQPEANEAMAWGHRVEAAALEAYSEMTGRTVRHVRTTRVSRTHPHVYASLDGRCVGERRGVEVKLTRTWTEPPRRVVIQSQTGMAVHALDLMDVVRVGMGYQAPAVFTIERDPAMGEELLELGEAWYRRYVMGDELPPVDGSRAASRHLDRLRGEPEMRAGIEQAALAARLQAVRRAQGAADAEERDLVNRLKASMQGSYALVGHGFRVSWRPSKPRVTTDWKAVASDYRQRLVMDIEDRWDEGPLRDEFLADLDEIESRHTTEGEGARPFRVTFEEAGND